MVSYSFGEDWRVFIVSVATDKNKPMPDVPTIRSPTIPQFQINLCRLATFLDVFTYQSVSQFVVSLAFSNFRTFPINLTRFNTIKLSQSHFIANFFLKIRVDFQQLKLQTITFRKK